MQKVVLSGIHGQFRSHFAGLSTIHSVPTPSASERDQSAEALRSNPFGIHLSLIDRFQSVLRIIGNDRAITLTPSRWRRPGPRLPIDIRLIGLIVTTRRLSSGVAMRRPAAFFSTWHVKNPAIAIMLTVALFPSACTASRRIPAPHRKRAGFPR